MSENRTLSYRVMLSFSEDERKSLHALKRSHKIASIQEFARAAVVKAIEDARLGKGTVVEQRRAESAPPEHPQPGGLGLFRGSVREHLQHQAEEDERWRRERRTDDEMPRISSPPPSVNVHVVGASGPASSTSGVDIATLARMIAETPESERRAAYKRACESLLRDARGRARSEEDARELSLALTDELDAMIKRLGGARPQNVLEKYRARAAAGERSASQASTPALDRVMGKVGT